MNEDLDPVLKRLLRSAEREADPELPPGWAGRIVARWVAEEASPPGFWFGWDRIAWRFAVASCGTALIFALFLHDVWLEPPNRLNEPSIRELARLEAALWQP